MSEKFTPNTKKNNGYSDGPHSTPESSEADQKYGESHEGDSVPNRQDSVVPDTQVKHQLEPISSSEADRNGRKEPMTDMDSISGKGPEADNTHGGPKMPKDTPPSSHPKREGLRIEQVPSTQRPSIMPLLLLALLIGLGLYYFTGSDMRNVTEIDFGFFRQQLKEGNIEQVILKDNIKLQGEFKKIPAYPTEKAESPTKSRTTKQLTRKFITVMPSPMEVGGPMEQEITQAVGNKFQVRKPVDTTAYFMLFSLVITVVLLGSIWLQFRRTRDQMNGGGIMPGFGKSPVKRFEQGADVVTFKDVAGLKTVKEELVEIVDFLAHADKYERMGARIPKGVLLVGPPGTGKTLLARATAGEAGVPFFSINGSEFIQMFVGVGASRVRDMFETARRSAPSILFIDEIDAVGRLRGTGIGGGNDEREQTLNQILSEMDGFAPNEVVIVLAATNRPDVLDPALLRPGRFDRHITVDSPAHKGRMEMFHVHTKKVPLAEDVVIKDLADATTGLTGADIRNIVNEAVLWCCRRNAEKVTMADFRYAIDKVQMGGKREEILKPRDKKMTAYHESGHTLATWLLPCRERVSKVSIIPRGRSLGVTQVVPEEDRVSICQSEIEQRLCVLLSGREAERLVFNELNAGAENDLKNATEIARKMVTHWGMSKRLGAASFRVSEDHPFLGKEIATTREFSENTAQVIDEEIMQILDSAAARAVHLLKENRNKLDALATALELREELDAAQIEEILGPSVKPEDQEIV